MNPMSVLIAIDLTMVVILCCRVRSLLVKILAELQAQDPPVTIQQPFFKLPGSTP